MGSLSVVADSHMRAIMDLLETSRRFVELVAVMPIGTGSAVSNVNPSSAKTSTYCV